MVAIKINIDVVVAGLNPVATGGPLRLRYMNLLFFRRVHKVDCDRLRNEVLGVF